MGDVGISVDFEQLTIIFTLLKYVLICNMFSLLTYRNQLRSVN